MKLASILTNVNKAMNWKVLVVITGLILSANLTACSTSEKVPTDAMKGDSMKKDGDAMKGDSMKKDGDAMQKSPSPTATNKP
jgi:pentapeptide MXKDX repeat protein